MHEDLFHAVSYGKFPDSDGECTHIDENAVVACLNPCPFCDEDVLVSFVNQTSSGHCALLTIQCCNGQCGCAMANIDVGRPHIDPLFARRHVVVDETKIKKAIMRWNKRPSALTSFASLTQQFINAVNRRAALRDKIHGAVEKLEPKQSGYESGQQLRKLLEGAATVSAPSVSSRDAARDLREALDCSPSVRPPWSRSSGEIAKILGAIS